MLFFESLYEPNEQFVQRLSLYERKQTLLLNNLTTESTKYALKMLNGRTCVSNQDEKQRLEELSFNESGKSERSRTKSKLTSKYGVTRRDREPSRLQCKIVIKMFKKSKSCRRCIKRYIMYNTPHSSAMRGFLSVDFRRYVATRLCKSSPVRKRTLSTYVCWTNNKLIYIVRMRTKKPKNTDK